MHQDPPPAAPESLTPARIRGLRETVSIRTDRWGVRHIDASSSHDAYVAQGWVAAEDRLFQMDLWRRRGLGRLAEVFGETHTERDRASRLFLYRGDMDREWAAYGPDAKSATEAFVVGVNARIETFVAAPETLPPEFAAYNYLPERWRASDVCRIRIHGIWHNAIKELERALTVRDFGPEVEELRQDREPWAPLDVPEGLDLAAVDAHALDAYRIATAPLSLTGEATGTTATDGSNNWVLAPERTTTGRPILASDPHRTITMPGTRYLIHLRCPDFDIIGAGEAWMPGVSLGHNGHVAFGLTVSPADQEDLYVYDLDPHDPSRYRWKGDWERMTTITEQVQVRGAEPRALSLQFTRHGPVTAISADGAHAFALRAAWLEPGGAPYMGSLAWQRATNVDEFVRALDYWNGPPVNHVFADTSGRIGWALRGIMPVRPNWDGTFPVPGDGRYEWDGFHAHADLPTRVDPADGVIATANQENLPDTPHWRSRPTTRDWQAPFRFQRISEVLASRERWDLAGAAALQLDVLSIPARQVLRHVASLRPEHTAPDLAAHWRTLAQWDFRMERNSSAAGLFGRWYRRHLRPALLRHAVSPHVAEGHVDDALRALDPHGYFGDPRADLRILAELATTAPDVASDLLSTSMRAAVADLSELLGADSSQWQWGRLLRVRFTHPGGEDAGGQAVPWSLEAAAQNGSPDTVGVAYPDPDGFQFAGASFRMTLDVGDWDASRTINVPGQSGVPGTRHFHDLRDLWQEGHTFPLLYSEAAVAAHTESVMAAEPAS